MVGGYLSPTFAIRLQKLLFFGMYLLVTIDFKGWFPKMVCSADFFYDPLEFTGLAAYLPSNCEGRVRAIHDKLRNGICIVALQKKKGRELGRGAEFSLEKPRLYLSRWNPGASRLLNAKTGRIPNEIPTDYLLNSSWWRGANFSLFQDGLNRNVKLYQEFFSMAQCREKARQSYSDEELRKIHDANVWRYFENRRLWRYLAAKNRKIDDT